MSRFDGKVKAIAAAATGQPSFRKLTKTTG